ncbi:MAG: phosphonopyruvate decarboxylase [Clostridiales bacterium]|nr:phosphonopyruvate decarboxylase [Clostridiales bacterium]
MKIQNFIDSLNIGFFTGVPDSQLKSLCDYLMDTYGIDPKHHVIAANEGNCVAIAAGYHLATGKVPAVYMQNSGEGNIVNPVASLMNDAVYAMPCVFIIGWRGEPNVHDEPQHIYQGQITLRLLDDLNIDYMVIDKSTTVEDVERRLDEWQAVLNSGRQVAFVVKKGGLEYDKKVVYKNDNKLNREAAVARIVNASQDDPIVSTTGKISRELFEIRERNKQSHKFDFLTVGSMGHCSSIALGVALNKPNSKVWCIDGDGAALMHMGAMAVIGSVKPNNLVHVVINNGAHETVGGMPTVAQDIDLCKIASACGYGYVVNVDNERDLDSALTDIKGKSELCFIEIKCALGSRADLGRPTTTAIENKNSFVDFLKSKK